MIRVTRTRRAYANTCRGQTRRVRGQWHVEDFVAGWATGVARGWMFLRGAWPFATPFASPPTCLKICNVPLLACGMLSPAHGFALSRMSSAYMQVGGYSQVGHVIRNSDVRVNSARTHESHPWSYCSNL
jgi:hypothetical protein